MPGNAGFRPIVSSFLTGTAGRVRLRIGRSCTMPWQEVSVPIHHVKDLIEYQQPFAPRLLHKDSHSKSMLICLEEQQHIPAHAESNQGFFYVLEGQGTFLSDEGEVNVKAGELVVALSGSTRGFRADRGRLAVLATAVLL